MSRELTDLTDEKHNPAVPGLPVHPERQDESSEDGETSPDRVTREEAPLKPELLPIGDPAGAA